MQTLKSLFDQALLIWNDATGAGRIGIVLLVVICVSSIVGIGIWAARPNYVVLASGITPSEASKIIDALDAADIAYQIKGSGSTIMVDKQKRARAKIAASDLGIGNDDSQQKETTPWMDPTSQQNIFKRNLERRLEATIAKQKNVLTAKVHLSIPEKQAFIRKSNDPSAAVMIEVAGQAKFGDSHALSIARMVANSVPGLKEADVAITDTAGNAYTTDDSNAHLDKQAEYRISRDQEFENKVLTILNPILGLGNASVTVTTDFTFPSGTKTVTKVDPDEKVLIDEQVNNSTTTTGGGGAIGVAGTGSNIGAEASASASSDRSLVTKSEDLTNKYEWSSTSSTETIQNPILEKLTVSVLVNQAAVQDENNVVPPEVIKQVENLVSSAVGLREGTDQITVGVLAFAEDATEVPPVATTIPWDQVNEILKNISLGLAALAAVFLGMKVIKKFQLEPSGVANTSGDQATKLSELAEMVQENPDVFAKIIASWSAADTVEADANERAA
jgi:flagellar M-ring protein FliF